ncbi:hypothetical protein Tco_1138115 [Tanacetum coccineum]
MGGYGEVHEQISFDDDTAGLEISGCIYGIRMPWDLIRYGVIVDMIYSASRVYIRHWAIHYGLMSYPKVPLIVDVVMMWYTIRSAAWGLVLPCTLIVSFHAGYMVFLLVAHCYYWLLVVTPGCMSVTAGSLRFVLALQTVSIDCVTFLLVVCAG